MLTVIVPSYNHEKYLLECLENLIEILSMGHSLYIIDDGSSDKSIEIIESFIANNLHYKIKLIAKKNSGLVDSLRKGLKYTTTEFIYYISSDDIPNSNNILKCYNKLKENNNLKFCIGGAKNLFEKKNKETFFYNNNHKSFIEKSKTERCKNYFRKFPFPIFLLQSTLFRTEYLACINTWDGSLVLDDTPIFYKILTNNNLYCDFIFEPDITVVKYRHHGKNSYNNIYRQYKIISEVVNSLAPVQIKKDSIESVVTFHLLKCMQTLQFNEFKKIIKESNTSIVKILLLVLRRYKYLFFR